VEHDPGLLRSHLTKQTDHFLFSLIITRLDIDPETGVKNILTDIIRHLCDVANLEEGAEKTSFMTLFYPHHANMLFASLTTCYKNLRLWKRYIEERKEEAWFDADDAEDEDYNPKNDTEGVPLPSLQEFKERTKKRGRSDGEDQIIGPRESPIKKQKKSSANNGKEKTKERT